jgi:hypothetical protein
MKVVVRDTANLGDVFLSSNDGGPFGHASVKDLIAAGFPDVAFEVTVEPSTGAAGLRRELESGESSLIGSGADLVVFSVADEVARLSDPSRGVEDLVREIEADLVAVVELIKAKVGAHVFIANLSTVEPGSAAFNYHGLDEEPYTLRAHRINLIVVDVSHNEGISIIDVDRKIAEVGAENAVVAPSVFNETGCGVIASEVVRIIEEYGFLDERPLLEQVGARAGKGSN